MMLSSSLHFIYDSDSSYAVQRMAKNPKIMYGDEAYSASDRAERFQRIIIVTVTDVLPPSADSDPASFDWPTALAAGQAQASALLPSTKDGSNIHRINIVLPPITEASAGQTVLQLTQVWLRSRHARRLATSAVALPHMLQATESGLQAIQAAASLRWDCLGDNCWLDGSLGGVMATADSPVYAIAHAVETVGAAAHTLPPRSAFPSERWRMEGVVEWWHDHDSNGRRGVEGAVSVRTAAIVHQCDEIAVSESGQVTPSPVKYPCLLLCAQVWRAQGTLWGVQFVPDTADATSLVLHDGTIEQLLCRSQTPLRL